MPAGVGMLGGVLVRGAVAAEDGAALLARAQMDPLGADLHAFGTLPALGVPDGRDRGEMCARSRGVHRFTRAAVGERRTRAAEP